jgi:murein DD-endopeptidase MepM/ murein hydrolase activator NlpD
VQAVEYIAKEMADGRFTTEHIAELVRAWQKAHELECDGMPGPHTRASIDKAISESRKTVILEATPPEQRCWPLRMLGGNRKPVVTSGYRHPARPDHVGVDIFYSYILDSDPPMRAGDGGRTTSNKWWIPDNTRAIAVADGRVTLASWTKTGFCVRIALEGGYSAGYFHLSSLIVKVGQSVSIGDPVGIVGDNPADYDARHLHFETYEGHTGWRRTNPEEFLGGAMVLPSK